MTIQRITRSILGLATCIESTADVVALADEAFVAWPRTPDPPTLRVRFRITDRPGRSREPFYDVRGPRLRILGPGVHVAANAARGRARGTVSAELLADAETFRYAVLEATVLFLATARDRIPFHAAGVARDGRVLLLAGPSGSGKSTLALAALRRGTGWKLLAEDCVYLENARRRIWGWPGFLHVAADAARFFPELHEMPATLTAAGKQKIALRDAGPVTHVAPTDRADILVLSRSGRAPTLEPMPQERASRLLTGRLEPGFDRFQDALPVALGPLVKRVWTFDPGPDPSAAAAFLETAIPSADPG